MDALDGVREVLRNQDLDAAVLSLRHNFAWLTSGGSSAVREATHAGVGKLVVTAEEVFLVADNIESRRLLAEEVRSLECTPIEYPWYSEEEPLALAQATHGRRCGSDDGSIGVDISEPLLQARSVLTPETQAFYRDFAPEVSACVEEVLRRVEPGWTEKAIAGEVQREAMWRGIRPDVVLVGVDDRVLNYRHTTVTDATLERYVMIVACGEKNGVIANATRFAHFGEMSAELRLRHEQAALILSIVNAATTPGRSYSDLWQLITDSYAEAGWDGEWKLHHQGGLTGYTPREWLISPSTTGEVQEGQAFAWNPSIAGAKSEDTILVTANGSTTITQTHSWPVLEVAVDGQKVQRAAVLER